MDEKQRANNSSNPEPEVPFDQPGAMDGLDAPLNELSEEVVEESLAEEGELPEGVELPEIEELPEEKLAREIKDGQAEQATKKMTNGQKNDEKASKRRYGVLILVILLLIGAVAGVAAWWILSGQNGDGGEAGSTGSSEEQHPEEKPEGEESEMTELSVDDELVQRLWGWFNSTHFPGENYIPMLPPLNDFYKLENPLILESIPAIYKMAFGLNALFYRTGDSYTSDAWQKCSVNHEWVQEADGRRFEYTAGVASCIPGDLIRSKAEEMFGPDITFQDGDAVIVNGEGYRYFAEGDEAVSTASGATSGFVYRIPYAAEQDAEHIYVYEVVTQLSPFGHPIIEEGQCMLGPGVMEDVSHCQLVYKLNGEEVDLGTTDITDERIIEYKDQLDKFKWTFKKTPEGNYIFEKREKL